MNKKESLHKAVPKIELSEARILEVAEETLRRFGPDKTTVVDVARALKVSHGSVYRYFASKADLRAAVVRRWLDATLSPLAAIVGEETPTLVKLRRWIDRLVSIKRERALADPELFAAYYILAQESAEVVKEHMGELRQQVSDILAEGALSGEVIITDTVRTAQAILDATVKFQNPAHAASWADPGIDDAYETVWQLIESGLKVRVD